MSDRSRQLAELGDPYEVMLAAVRSWLERCHPEARYAVVVAELGDGVPSVKVPVLNPTCDPCAVAAGG